MPCQGVPLYEARKLSLREKLREILKHISPRLRKQKSIKIRRRLFKKTAFKKAEKILCFMSLLSEVEMRPLVRGAWKLKKKIYLPKVNKKNKTVTLYSIQNLTRDLKKGAYGIYEPRALLRRKGRLEEMDLILVPGLGFTKLGARLGQGGGYYDRLLKKVKAKKIALAFREQLLPVIPMMRRDVWMDEVITD